MNHAREADCEVEIACRRDGTILGLRGEVFVDLGAYIRTNGLIAAAQPGAMLQRPLSRAEHPHHLDSAADQQDAVRHLSRARPLRGLVLLRAADRVGGARPGDRQRRDAAAQPDRRRRDAVPARRGWSRAVRPATPSATAATTAKRSNAASPNSAGTEKRALQGREIDGRYHGVAVACFIEGGGAGPKETARLDARGGWHGVGLCRLRRRSGRASKRSWRRSRPTRSACRSSRCACLHGSTPLLDEGYGAFASRSTVLGGSAVFEAANAAARQDPRRRRPRGSAEPPKGRAGGRQAPALPTGARSPSPSWQWTGCRSTTAFANDNRLTYAYGTAAAHVAVDPGTGDVELLDCLVVEDVGRIVNPLTLHGQVIGGGRPRARRRLPGAPRL